MVSLALNDIASCYALDGGWERAVVPRTDGDGSGVALWLRRSWRLPAAMRGRRLRLRFLGGVAPADVWLNGRYLGRHQGPRHLQEYDVTRLARVDAENQLVVRTIAPPARRPWRQVLLLALPPTAIAGVAVQMVDGGATLAVEVQHGGARGAPARLEVYRRGRTGLVAAWEGVLVSPRQTPTLALPEDGLDVPGQLRLDLLVNGALVDQAVVGLPRSAVLPPTPKRE